MKGLPEWTKEEDDFQDNLLGMYKAVEGEYITFMNHVGSFLGKRYINSKTDLQSGPVFIPVPRIRQKEAVTYYASEVFQTPKWLIEPIMVQRIGIKPVEEIKGLQGLALATCVSPKVMLNIVSISQTAKDPYTLPEYLKDLERGIWEELNTHSPIDIYRRNLQKMYISQLGLIVKPGANVQGPSPTTDSDVSSDCRADIAALKKRIEGALPAIHDQATRYHLIDINSRIAKILSDKD
ncbi:zinc-dependent metalloprotease [Mucilaginibacter jinjuensis]|uniref:Zinc-dependent metalloprotease n=1 Tax=Mucilaginibacter jinjuensis TaxID=1176721 RepID=A0ABY7TCI9_9SPHI|nr:zinc-dependent metalloprotease [Mucilaginibacter jinjuensis]WCT14087.1 zinc-dependent metalloprotease [Mucilaginibacter jinjuensis]